MKLKAPACARYLAGLAVIVGLPVLGSWARRDATRHCALDGVKLDPHYQVQVIDGAGQARCFCCPRCAALWIERQPSPCGAVRVTDERGGEWIDASAAYFVRSLVVTTAANGNRIHVFRDRVDAERHAELFGGKVLDDTERPFR
jgi:hypothetical protein